jgi:hypothetical protein
VDSASDELKYIETKLKGVKGLGKKSANNFAHHAAEFARGLVGDRLEQVFTRVVWHENNPDGGYKVRDENKTWPLTELTRVILETGGVVFDYKTCDKDTVIYCQYHTKLGYKLNMPKLIPAAIRAIYPSLTDVKPAFGVEDPLTQYCWSAKNRHGKTFLLSFGEMCSYKTGYPVFDFFVRHFDMNGIPFELVRERVDPKSHKSNSPEKFADELRYQAIKEFLSRRKASRSAGNPK